jgi:hypothetical protein
MTNTVELANTIRSQIMAAEVKGCKNGIHAMMCWGFSQPRTVEVEGNQGLCFSVNGIKFKGKIAVTLDLGSDTYQIWSFNPKGEYFGWTPKEERVYWEDLAQILDNIIEG